MNEDHPVPLADWEGALRRLGPPRSRFAEWRRAAVGLGVFALGSGIGYGMSMGFDAPDLRGLLRSLGSSPAVALEADGEVLADERLADPAILLPLPADPPAVARSRTGEPPRIALPALPTATIPDAPPRLSLRLAARGDLRARTSQLQPRMPRELQQAALAPPSALTLPAEPKAPTWRRNAVPLPHPGDRPMIAIVIDDLGIDRRRVVRASALPGPLTMALLPYAARLPEQAEAVRRAGHELLLHLPMEPLRDDIDPGPNALLTDLPQDELMRRLRWNLSRFDGFVGVNNHMGSRFTADPAAMTPVARWLRREGLLFLDSRTTPRSVAAALTGAHGVPTATRDVFIDHSQNPERVAAQLRLIERIARRTGSAIAIGHPHDVTLAALAAWLPTLARRGFVLVPLSAIYRTADERPAHEQVRLTELRPASG